MLVSELVSESGSRGRLSTKKAIFSAGMREPCGPGCLGAGKISGGSSWRTEGSA